MQIHNFTVLKSCSFLIILGPLPQSPLRELLFFKKEFWSKHSVPDWIVPDFCSFSINRLNLLPLQSHPPQWDGLLYLTGGSLAMGRAFPSECGQGLQSASSFYCILLLILMCSCHESWEEHSPCSHHSKWKRDPWRELEIAARDLQLRTCIQPSLPKMWQSQSPISKTLKKKKKACWFDPNFSSDFFSCSIIIARGAW